VALDRLREALGDKRLLELMRALAERLTEIEAMVANSTRADAAAALHSWRGAAAMLEQVRLADALHRLENAIRAGEDVGLAEVVAERAELTAKISHWGQ
jgi:HPt (histidine-containing phosphotransfer) domain-containing protein